MRPGLGVRDGGAERGPGAAVPAAWARCLERKEADDQGDGPAGRPSTQASNLELHLGGEAADGGAIGRARLLDEAAPQQRGAPQLATVD